MKLLTEKRPIGVQLTLKEFVKKFIGTGVVKTEFMVEAGGYKVKIDLEYDEVDINYIAEVISISFNPYSGAYTHSEMFVKLKAKNKEK